MDSIKILRSLGMWTVEVQGQSTEYISPEEFAVLPEGSCSFFKQLMLFIVFFQLAVVSSRCRGYMF